MKCAIQGPYGGHHDLCDIAEIANDRGESLALSKNRQRGRFDEIQVAWETTKALLTDEPSRWQMDATPDKAALWGLFIRLARNFSYDSLVAYFGSYVADDQPRDSPPPPRSV